jgi:hypothetical protein
MTWFVERETYVRKIVDPESKEEAEVTMRPLNAGDRAEFNEIRLLSDGEGGGEGTLRPGRMQLLTVERAVVSWTIPGPQPSAEAIFQLDPRVFDQLYELVSFGNPPEAEGSEAWRKAQKTDEPGEGGEVVPLEKPEPEHAAAGTS